MHSSNYSAHTLPHPALACLIFSSFLIFRFFFRVLIYHSLDILMFITLAVALFLTHLFLDPFFLSVVILSDFLSVVCPSLLLLSCAGVLGSLISIFGSISCLSALSPIGFWGLVFSLVSFWVLFWLLLLFIALIMNFTFLLGNSLLKLPNSYHIAIPLNIHIVHQSPDLSLPIIHLK